MARETTIVLERTRTTPITHTPTTTPTTPTTATTATTPTMGDPARARRNAVASLPESIKTKRISTMKPLDSPSPTTPYSCSFASLSLHAAKNKHNKHNKHNELRPVLVRPKLLQFRQIQGTVAAQQQQQQQQYQQQYETMTASSFRENININSSINSSINNSIYNSINHNNNPLDPLMDVRINTFVPRQQKRQQRRRRLPLPLPQQPSSDPEATAAAGANDHDRDGGFTRRLYARSGAVPDSMKLFAAEIHRENRITRSEEIELGTKTQEAMRLNNIHEQLKKQLLRDPTDDEWCAASGKINMQALAQAIDDGLSAKNKLVTSNLRMVQSLVNSYLRNGLAAHYNAADMMQEGILALIRAAEMFEPHRGFKFSTYAMYWVRVKVKTAQVAQSRIIALPQRVHIDAKKITILQTNLHASLGRMPTTRELALAVGMTEKYVDRCLTANSLKAVSLDHGGISRNNNKKRGMLAETNQDESLSSFIADEDTETAEQVMLREDMLRCLQRHLGPDQLLLILLRFGLFGQSPASIAELSALVGQTPDKVRRRIAQTIQILQDAGVDDEWRSFGHDIGF